MKKVILILFLVSIFAIPLFAQKPQVKFINYDGAETIYNIEDISKINLIKSNMFNTMQLYLNDTNQVFLFANLDSITFVDLYKLKIYLPFYQKTFYIAEIDSIVFKTNSCNEVKIGTQTWMCNNLNVDHYKNGDTIIQIRDNHEWQSSTSGAWRYYLNNKKNGQIYGKLYNWYSVNDPRGLAPEGWHISSDEEWTILSEYLGGDFLASEMLKSSGTLENGDGLWTDLISQVANQSGFSAQPGGYINDNGSCNLIHFSGYWWTSSEVSYTNALCRYMTSHETKIITDSCDKRCGYSVRCIKGYLPIINSIIPSLLKAGEIFTIKGTGFGVIQEKSYVSFNSLKPGKSDYQSWSDTEIKVRIPIGVRTGKVYVSMNGHNSNKIDFSVNVEFGTVSDIDKNTYKTVKIGNQWWMAENFNVSRYRNGDIIPQIKNIDEWANLKTGAWCYYDNDPENGNKFGKLYNWYAVNDPRGLAPDGWHVSKNDDWTNLSNYINEPEFNGGYLKSTGIIENGTGLWRNPNTGATNQIGFSGLPGGYRLVDSFDKIGYFSFWWTSNNAKTSNCWALSYIHSKLSSMEHDINMGFSVRCVKD